MLLRQDPYPVQTAQLAPPIQILVLHSHQHVQIVQLVHIVHQLRNLLARLVHQATIMEILQELYVQFAPLARMQLALDHQHVLSVLLDMPIQIQVLF
jgi:hypothetical protein